MSGWMLLLPILVPALLAGVVFVIPRRLERTRGLVAVAGSGAAFAFSIFAFASAVDGGSRFRAAWGGFGFDLALRLYNFSGFIVLALSAFAFLIALYSFAFMRGRPAQKSYYGWLLLTLGLACGAVLAGNLVVMLFFWEGLLATLFGLIMTGGKSAFPTAVKALVINGAADLCLMLGIGIAASLAGSSDMGLVRQIPADGLGGVAFVLMFAGASAKAGAMPFHTWIPDAALDAPLPVMAFLPGALEKLVGIYLLARVSLDFFAIAPGSWMSTLMMTVGAATVIFAVLMALVQKNFKRLLSYHAVSQVGYMILGIGTALPIGIVGGLFHMVNNAMYKSGLFLAGGSVEKATGTTELSELGGLGKRMPVTFGCFLVCAAAISGVPFFSGFYSKELVFEAARESGIVFYIIAVLGAFFTAASFLKLGHAAFLGKPNPKLSGVKESSPAMLIPMVAIAAGCVLFGVGNQLPLQTFIQPIAQPIVGGAGESFWGVLPHDWLLAAISVGVLALALVNHLFGARRSGSGLGAVDHIHDAPGLRTVYALAEKRRFDPYEIGRAVVRPLARALYAVDRAIDWVYDVLAIKTGDALSRGIRIAHTGSHSMYIVWSFLGAIAIAVVIVLLHL